MSSVNGIASSIGGTSSATPNAGIGQLPPQGTTNADVAPVTPGEIAGYSLDQLSALSLSQISELSAADVAAISVDWSAMTAYWLNGLNRAAIVGISDANIAKLTTTAISGLSSAFVTAMTPDQVSALSLEQLSAFSSSQLSQLGATQVAAISVDWSAMTAYWLNNLSSAAVAGISDTNIANLTTAAISGLSNAFVAAMTPTQVSAFSLEQLSAFSPSQISQLDAAQVAAISVDWSAMTAYWLNNLSSAAVAGISDTNIANLTTAAISGLSNAFVAAMTPTQVSTFSLEQLSAFSPSQISQLDAAQVAAISVDWSAMTAYWLNNLSSAAVAGISDTNIANLTTAAISGLSNAFVAALNIVQISALNFLQLSAFSPSQISQLSALQVSGIAGNWDAMTAYWLNNLSPAAVSGIYSLQIMNLTAATISGLSNAFVAALTPEQLSEFSPEQISVFTPSQLSQFSAAQIGALSAAQIGALSAGQFQAINGSDLTAGFLNNLQASVLESITAAQMQSLSADTIAGLSNASAQAYIQQEIQFLQGTDWLSASFASTIQNWNSLSNLNFGLVTSTFLNALSTTAFQTISQSNFQNISASALAGLSQSQMANISTTMVGWLTPTQLGAININWLSPASIMAISPNEISDVTTNFGSLSNTALNHLTQAMVEGMTVAQMGQFTAAQIPYLGINWSLISDTQLNAMNVQAFQAMFASNVSSLTASQLQGLDSDHVQAIADIASTLSSSQLATLTNDWLSGAPGVASYIQSFDPQSQIAAAAALSLAVQQGFSVQSLEVALTLIQSAYPSGLSTDAWTAMFKTESALTTKVTPKDGTRNLGVTRDILMLNLYNGELANATNKAAVAQRLGAVKEIFSGSIGNTLKALSDSGVSITAYPSVSWSESVGKYLDDVEKELTAGGFLSSDAAGTEFAAEWEKTKQNLLTEFGNQNVTADSLGDVQSAFDLAFGAQMSTLMEGDAGLAELKSIGVNVSQSLKSIKATRTSLQGERMIAGIGTLFTAISTAASAAGATTPGALASYILSTLGAVASAFGIPLSTVFEAIVGDVAANGDNSTGATKRAAIKAKFNELLGINTPSSAPSLASSVKVDTQSSASAPVHLVEGAADASGSASGGAHVIVEGGVDPSVMAAASNAIASVEKTGEANILKSNKYVLETSKKIVGMVSGLMGAAAGIDGAVNSADQNGDDSVAGIQGIVSGALGAAGGVTSTYGSFLEGVGKAMTSGEELCKIAGGFTVVGDVMNLVATGAALGASIAQTAEDPAGSGQQIADGLSILDNGLQFLCAVVATIASVFPDIGPIVSEAVTVIGMALPNFESAYEATQLESDIQTLNGLGMTKDAEAYNVLYQIAVMNATPMVSWFSGVYTPKMEHDEEAKMNDAWFVADAQQHLSADLNYVSDDDLAVTLRQPIYDGHFTWANVITVDVENFSFYGSKNAEVDLGAVYSEDAADQTSINYGAVSAPVVFNSATGYYSQVTWVTLTNSVGDSDLNVLLRENGNTDEVFIDATTSKGDETFQMGQDETVLGGSGTDLYMISRQDALRDTVNVLAGADATQNIVYLSSATTDTNFDVNLDNFIGVGRVYGSSDGKDIVTGTLDKEVYFASAATANVALSGDNDTVFVGNNAVVNMTGAGATVMVDLDLSRELGVSVNGGSLVTANGGDSLLSLEPTDQLNTALASPVDISVSAYNGEGLISAYEPSNGGGLALSATGFNYLYGTEGNDNYTIGDQSGVAAAYQLNGIQTGNGNNTITDNDTSGALSITLGQGNNVMNLGDSADDTVETVAKVTGSSNQDVINLGADSSLTAFLSGNEVINAMDETSYLAAVVYGGTHEIDLGGQSATLQFEGDQNGGTSVTNINSALFASDFLTAQDLVFENSDTSQLYAEVDANGDVHFAEFAAGTNNATLQVNYSGDTTAAYFECLPTGSNPGDTPTASMPAGTLAAVSLQALIDAMAVYSAIPNSGLQTMTAANGQIYTQVSSVLAHAMA